MPTFDAREFLEFAKEVASSPRASEARLRTSVGRAYYAVFLVARDRMMVIGGLGPMDTRQDIHRAVVGWVKEKKSSLGNQLDALKRLRLQADYVLSDADPRYEAIYSAWSSNWSKAQEISGRILPNIQRLGS